MKISPNYTKEYDEKIDISVSPLEIPYDGGNVEIFYKFNEYKKFKNGFITKSLIKKIKTVYIEPRLDNASKNVDNIINGEFYDSELDRVIKWDGVKQLGLPTPQLSIDMNDVYYCDNEIELKYNTSDNIIPEIEWSDSVVKKNSRAAYSTTIDGNKLTFNKKFEGIIKLTVSAVGYIPCTKLISVNCDSVAKLSYDVKDITQSTYEVDYNTKSFTLSFNGITNIIYDDKVLSTEESNYIELIRIPCENLGDRVKVFNSVIKWNNIDINYSFKQHGAKECNGNIDYQIVSVSPQNTDEYIGWDETIVNVKYMTNTIEHCYDGSIRETYAPFEENVVVEKNNTSLDIVRCGTINWKNTNINWKCLQTANPGLILINSKSYISNVGDGFEISYDTKTAEIFFTGVTTNTYENGSVETIDTVSSLTVSFEENNSLETKLIDGNILWNNYYKEWKIYQKPNPKRIISTQYDIEVIYPTSEEDTIKWDDETLEVKYNKVTIAKTLDGSIETYKEYTTDVKEIGLNKELLPIILNGNIVWHETIKNWTCTQLPNEGKIFKNAEFLIENITDGFTVPSTATSATIKYDAVTRMYFKDGHHEDVVDTKQLNLSFRENITPSKITIDGIIRWNGAEYNYSIYQRGKRINKEQ